MVYISSVCPFAWNLLSSLSSSWTISHSIKFNAEVDTSEKLSQTALFTFPLIHGILNIILLILLLYHILILLFTYLNHQLGTRFLVNKKFSVFAAQYHRQHTVQVHWIEKYSHSFLKFCLKSLIFSNNYLIFWKKGLVVF